MEAMNGASIVLWCRRELRGHDPAGLVRAAVGTDIPIEILSVQNWLPRQLVAKRYGSPRCFLAGDACHLFVRPVDSA